MEYDHDAVGRVDRITGPGLPAYGAEYGRVDDSELIEHLWYKSDANTVLATAERGYEATRDLVEYVENSTTADPPGLVSRYEYGNDALGRRTSVVETGAAFADDSFNLYQYNDRNELKDAERYLGTDIEDVDEPVDAEDFGYVYDPIGNRKQYYLPSGQTRTYVRNNVNQYTVMSNPSSIWLHDSDGNLDKDSKYKYLWDGENRLIEVATRIELTPNTQGYDNGDKKLTFRYDYLGRRVEKAYFTYNGSAWMEQSRRRFVYDRWNVVMVLDANDGNAILRKYTWGLDLSGTLGGAGGIGGLLAVEEPQAVGDPDRYWFFYDANGNVGQVIDAGDSSIGAKYRYDGYGNTVSATGAYALSNPYRFSTKWLDDELTHDTTWVQSAFGATGLYYYGYRYYGPHVGRWVSRDPIAERGGLNLYSFTENSPADRTDSLGLLTETNEWLRDHVPCFADAMDGVEADHIADGATADYSPWAYNGFKTWHCTFACRLLHECVECPASHPRTIFDRISPDPKCKECRVNAAGLVFFGGLVYEFLTMIGIDHAGSWDNQTSGDWLIDTPGDIRANLIGWFVWAMTSSPSSCVDSCKALTHSIRGPHDSHLGPRPGNW